MTRARLRSSARCLRGAINGVGDRFGLRYENRVAAGDLGDGGVRARRHLPLCGGRNDCQLCTAAAYKGPCWCESAKIPPELLVRVPTEARNSACICRTCVNTFHREQAEVEALPVVPGDFYFDSSGLMVFTAAYHQRRGYCCGNDCRHCPYQPKAA